MSRFGCLCVLLLSVARGLAWAEDQPQPVHVPVLQVTVYFTKDYKHWPETEQAIHAAAKEFGKAIALELVDYGKEYLRLRQAEKDLGLKGHETGEVMVVLGRFPLINKGDGRREIEQFIAPALKRLLLWSDLKQRRKPQVDAFAKEIFGAQIAIATTGAQPGDVYYKITAHDQVVGWVVDVYREIWCPICANAQFLMAVSNDLKVKAVKPVHELEVLGKPLSDEEAQHFLKQFKEAALKEHHTVDVVSGATKTSQAYEKGVNEVLDELKRRSAKE